jgi:hypothetical protein
METFVTPVLMRQKYVEDANKKRVFLNSRKIRKLYAVRSQGEANVEIVVVGKSLCL